MKPVIFSAILLVFSCLPFAGLADEGIDLNDLRGTYTNQVKNGDISGNRFTTQDELTIIPLSKNTAYFHTQLWFFNGHECQLSGIADAKDNVLTYFRFKNEDGNNCTFRIKVSDQALSFEDADGTCRSDTCGTRGGYDGTIFLRNKLNKKINEEKILDSDEYYIALAEHQSVLENKELSEKQKTHDWYRAAGEVAHLKKLSETRTDYAPGEVGMHYLKGDGVTKNVDEARGWFVKGNELDDPSAQYELGLLFEGGLSVPQDYSKALTLYRKAALQNFWLAECALGRILAKGLAGKADYQEAYFWLKAANIDAPDRSRLTPQEDPLAHITAEEKAAIDSRVDTFKEKFEAEHRQRK